MRSTSTLLLRRALLAVMIALVVGACASDGPAVAEAVGGSAEPTAAALPAATTIPTTAPILDPTPTAVSVATPQPTLAPEPSALTATDPPRQQAFCQFMATRFFWEPALQTEFLELMPAQIPTSIVVPIRASQILSTPGLGDASTNSLATMVSFTTFGSDLALYLDTQCPGVNWAEIVDAVTGDPDFTKLGDPLVPSSEFDLCAEMAALDGQLEVERGSATGTATSDTMFAAQRFASAIEPDAPFEVLAFSHQLVTQVALASSGSAYDVYINVIFDDRSAPDAVANYFDLVCPQVRDTREWLTPPLAAGAIRQPESRKGLAEGWEVVPAEDVRSSFAGDLRTLPVGEYTPLLVQYPSFESEGVEFTSLGADWFTVSADPPEAQLTLSWIFGAQELPVDISRFAFVGPDGTRYPAVAELSAIQPEFVTLVFVLDVIPESLSDWQFGVLPG